MQQLSPCKALIAERESPSMMTLWKFCSLARKTAFLAAKAFKIRGSSTPGNLLQLQPNGSLEGSLIMVTIAPHFFLESTDPSKFFFTKPRGGVSHVGLSCLTIGLSKVEDSSLEERTSLK